MWINIWSSPISSIYIWSTPIREVYVWSTKVRPASQPWPVMNFLAHYPLEWNLNDTSWNGYNWSLTWTISYVTLSSGKKVLSVNYSGKTQVTTTLTTAPATASVWIYKDPTNDPHPWYWKKFMWQDVDNYNWNWEVWAWWLFGYGDWQSWPNWYYLKSQDKDIISYDLTQSTWIHLCWVYDWTTTHFYVNWVEIWTMVKPFIAQTAFYFLDTSFTWDASYRRYYWMMSEVCLLTNAWSSSDVLDYYNATKSDYWL